MMHGLTKWIFVAALASGCILTDGSGGGGGGGGDGPPLVVRNNSSTRICYIQVSSAADNNWGPDQLGAQETLDPGGTKGWNVSAPGEWDVRLSNCSNPPQELDHRRISVGAGGGEYVYP